MATGKEYLKDIEKARRDLRALISSKNCAPIMLRLAWHDAGTYDATTKTGGVPNGSIRNEAEYKHGANNEEIKTKYTYSDIYQLAGVVAVEVTGGPTIHSFQLESSPDEGRLPDAREDIVALFGAYTLVFSGITIF